ncbi:MAG TPA: hypothetical protein ENI81_10675, partial [Phycisphaerales bacterium]|nr:hypothetical protein [Phycisphaerales bacterium]
MDGHSGGRFVVGIGQGVALNGAHLELQAGENVLEIAIREDGTQLDGFVITNNLALDEDAMPSEIDPPPIAGGPVPEDGAIEVDAATLEWTSPGVAVSSTVYLSTDETIDDADLLGETDLGIILAALEPGVSYWWRVDSVEADGTVNTGEVWTFATIALETHFPVPEDGAQSQALDAKLSWTAGKVVIMHDVYFGTDESLIAARDAGTFKGKLMDASYDPGELAAETTYYWAVDQFTPTGTVAGPIWSFTTIGAIPITDPNVKVYFSFDGLEGDLVFDESGHSHHGLLMGDPQLNPVGVVVGCLDFDGDGDYVDAGTSAALDGLSANMSASAWINIRSITNSWMTIMAKGENAWRIAINNGTLGLHFGFTGGDRGWQAANSASEIGLNEWHLVVATYDTIEGAKIYIDGVVDGSNPDLDGVQMNNMPFLVGENPEAVGRFFDGLIDEVRVYDITLTGADILNMVMSDVTGPGDVVKGVPDEPRDGDIAGWPDGEYPWMTLDDDTSTKFLHFRGDVSPTGFVVEPAMGPTIVTGLTFTTANDDYGRDPTSFEVYGSNESIDGPYELIAAGDVVDFMQADVWPRFTMNATPITFPNMVAYKYYQVLFPTVRDVSAANSMQIGEVELLGVLPTANVLVGAFAFGSRLLECATYNDPTVNYTMVHHESVQAIEYDAARGYGYEVIYPVDSPFGNRSCYGVFGPFDDSANNRNEFPDESPEELYDSFIGAKNFTNEVSEVTMGDKMTPSPT